jgi:hypothetical protein
MELFEKGTKGQVRLEKEGLDEYVFFGLECFCCFLKLTDFMQIVWLICGCKQI